MGVARLCCCHELSAVICSCDSIDDLLQRPCPDVSNMSDAAECASRVCLVPDLVSYTYILILIDVGLRILPQVSPGSHCLRFHALLPPSQRTLKLSVTTGLASSLATVFCSGNASGMCTCSSASVISFCGGVAQTRGSGPRI